MLFLRRGWSLTNSCAGSFSIRIPDQWLYLIVGAHYFTVMSVLRGQKQVTLSAVTPGVRLTAAQSSWTDGGVAVNDPSVHRKHGSSGICY